MNQLTRFAITMIIALSISVFVSSAAAEVDYDAYSNLLERYVTDDGVAYTTWSQNEADLNHLDFILEEWSQVDVEALLKADQKAFYINLYNAGMLQAVFKNYPLKSVKKIGLIPFSIFKKDFIHQADRMLSLDDVEKGILLKDFADPRIHFVVNCASESCPPLRAEPYCSSKLEAQLTKQTRLFAESDRAARKNAKGRYAYSELFNWYNDDFPGKHPAQYLNQYRSEPLPVDAKFDWIPYDWSLNEANSTDLK
ncbi:MAG: DUF547 domain-containing protein [Lentimonas sp.]